MHVTSRNQTIPSHSGTYGMHITAFIVATLLLAYPLAWLQIIDPVNGFQFLPLFSPATLTIVAMFACLLRFKKLTANLATAKYIVFLICIFIAIASFRVIANTCFNSEEYLSSLECCFIPLAFYLYAEESMKMLPQSMCFIWVGSVLISIREYITTPHIMYGIPGNYNWNATLIAVSAIFVIYQLQQKLHKNAKYKQIIILSIPAVISLSIIYLCTSKGTFLGLITALLLYSAAIAGRYRRYLLGILIATAISGYAVLLLRPDIIEKTVKDDVRIALWQGCSSLIRDHGIIGTSPAGFENAFAEYVPENYFLNKNAAVRHNHPHNEFLYIFAAWGIPAGLCWAALILYPLFNLVFNYAKNRTPARLPLMLAFTVLLVHGAVDLILFEWPTNCLFLWLLGLLWFITWEPKKIENASTPQTKRHKATVTIMLITLFTMITFNLYSGYFAWSAIRHYSQKNYVLAAAAFDRACRIKSDPYLIYRAANNAYFRLHDPNIALKYFRKLEQSGYRNYANNNGITGQILFLQGHPREALPYLTQETINFPLSIIAWYYASQAQMQLGLKEDAAISMQQLLRALNAKKLTLKQLPFILENPYYDLKWQEINLPASDKPQQTP